jgi:hypothetical protein
MLIFPFSPGKMKKEKQSLRRRDLLGWAEGVTFREMGQQVGRFNCGKKR